MDQALRQESINDKGDIIIDGGNTHFPDTARRTEYVESKGCKEILNELIWEGFRPEDIPFDKLPEKCVIKVTHGSTFNIICKDSSKLDREEVIKKCNKWLKAKFKEGTI